MKRIALIVALLLCVASAFAQEATPKKAEKSSATKTSRLTGCISGPNAENAFLLTNGRHRKGVEVGGNNELKNYVGQQVRLTGTWSDAKAIGVTEQAQKNAEKGDPAKEGAERKFKVDTITKVADTCPALGARGRKKAKTEGEAPKQ